MDDRTYGVYLHHENYDHHHHKEHSPHLEIDNKATFASQTLYTPLRHKKKIPFRLTPWRWLALLLMNLLLIGYFAVFDSPQPLQTAIKRDMKVTDQQYSYLYSSVAIPNLILPLVAGYLVDAMGVRPAMFIFGLMVLVGQVVLAYGAQIVNFDMMIVGRAIYSLGADPLNIAQIVMVNRWFKEREVALALSLATLMAGGGKAFNSVIVPVIYDATGKISAPLYFGVILCVFSLICVIIMVIWDKANEERELALDPDYFRHTETSEKVNLSDIKKFKPIVWLLVFNFGMFDGIVFTLRSFLNDFYYNLYGYSTQKAGNFISVHYLVMAFASPLAGKLVDKVGKRSSIIFYNSFLGLIAFAFYLIVPTCDGCWTPIIPLILLGLCIGIDDAAVFAALPLVLDEKYLGTGYGLYYVVENLLLSFLPPAAGYISGRTTDIVQGYYWMAIFLLVFTVLAVIEAFGLFVVDKKTGNVLDKTVFKGEGEGSGGDTDSEVEGFFQVQPGKVTVIPEGIGL